MVAIEFMVAIAALSKRLSRRERAAAEQIGTLMTIILTIVVALAVYFIVLPMFSRAGAAAAISLSASGTGSPDGTSAVVTLVIQNTGSSPAAVYAIHLTPYGVAAISDATPSQFTYGGATKSVSFAFGTAGSPPAAPSAPAPSAATGNLPVPANGQTTVSFTITGTNLYPGAQVRVTVYAIDANSGTPTSASVVVTLR